MTIIATWLLSQSRDWWTYNPSLISSNASGHHNCLNLSEVQIISSAEYVQIYPNSTMELNLSKEWELTCFVFTFCTLHWYTAPLKSLRGLQFPHTFKNVLNACRFQVSVTVQSLDDLGWRKQCHGIFKEKQTKKKKKEKKNAGNKWTYPSLTAYGAKKTFELIHCF